MLSKSLARLSSGSKIVSPSDDAAGLAVSSRLDAQLQRLSAAKANVGNAVSFIQTQDGYLKKIGKALDRMSELSILAQDVTKTDEDRLLYNKEFRELAAYLTSAAGKDFNGVSLFSATTLGVIMDSEGATFAMVGLDLDIAAFTGAIGATVGDVGAAGNALAAVKTAINQIAEYRAQIGANQTRLTYTMEQLTVSRENLTAANSRIKDVNVADESTEFARYNILVQSGTAMLAQANAQPNSVLKLLQ
jgi:flagellin